MENDYSDEGVKFYFEIALSPKQYRRLNFIVQQFHPEFRAFKPTKENYKKFEAIKNKTMNDALLNYYKEILGNVNQGNEHEGIPLVNEI